MSRRCHVLCDNNGTVSIEVSVLFLELNVFDENSVSTEVHMEDTLISKYHENKINVDFDSQG